MESKRKNKKKNGPPLFSEGDEGGGGLTGTRASEAKGPFPGGKRVGSWGKKRKKKESKRKKKETHPAQWDGLEGIEKKVGSWGKKKNVKERKQKKKVRS
jgi:hypothetical protein